MKLNMKMSLLISADKYGGTTLEITDDKSHCTFLRANITEEQLVLMMGRMACVKIEATVVALDKVGKRCEFKEFVFKVSDKDDFGHEERKEKAIEEGLKQTPDGWIMETYFGSQSSFFDKGKEVWARTRIERYIDETEEKV